MPISRYHIRSAHGLADPELHHAADKDDAEALLESIAMAGLVGFLRQLGDLAQVSVKDSRVNLRICYPQSPHQPPELSLAGSVL